MNSKLCTAIIMIFAAASLLALDYQLPANLPPTRDIPQGIATAPLRTPPAYTFTRNPMALMTSYYDYMIGSYNSLPIRVIPSSAGGGYVMTFHGRRTATGTRRVFWAYIDANGTLYNNSEITATNTLEGYPTLAVDPVSGKPLYAWHANYDTDAEYEDLFVADAFLGGIGGLFGDIAVIQNAPITITPSNAAATSDNEFIWPSAVIGPSPIAGKRRVYVIMRNGTTHTYGPCENAYLRFADFDATDIENGIALTWNTSNQTIPEMNDWNHDDQWRRPFYALAVDNAGNLFYAGYHTAKEANGTTNINEADLDIFKCPNYGQGTWTRISAFSNLPAWNPPLSATSNTGYFTDDAGNPYADDELRWVMMNSSHMNAVVDNLGRVHVPGLWALENADYGYYPALQFMKEFVFDPSTSQFSIHEIYPKVNPANTHDNYFQPWDTAVPWGVVDQWGVDANTGSFPLMVTDWDFPYWDSTVHSDAMMFHYNNFKMTEPNGNDMMACVWQNSQRARWANANDDPNYAAYINTPEICISVSPDNGTTWSEPIYLNNVDTPQLAGIKPMWVYPADKVIYTGMQGNQKVGKLGFMFYNDYTWGSYVLTPPVHPNNDGGQVMFMELQIVFPDGSPDPVDPFGTPVVLSGSMSVMAEVHIEGQNAVNDDVVAAYVDVNGTPQLRGRGTVQVLNGIPGCLLQIYTETNGETVYFKVWDYSTQRVLPALPTLPSEVNGIVGSWPSNLFQINAGAASTVQTPTFSPAAGTYQSAQNVSINCTTSGAQIRYTTNGADPTESSALYSAPIPLPLNSTTTIKARAFLSGWTPSAIASGQYVITGSVANPVFSPVAGTYSTAQSVSITCTTTGAQIRYTTNGTEPTSSSALYSAPINIAVTTTLKAKGFKTDWTPSATVTATYVITGTVATPVFNPVAGTYQTAQNISISCATPGAQIRYTTDNSEPTATSTLYTTPIPLPLNSTATIKAKGFRTDWTPSLTTSASYVITGQVPLPTYDPPAGSYEEALDVVMQCDLAGSTIHYTLDGSTPTDQSPQYSDPIHLTQNTTIKAIAVKADWIASGIATAEYQISSDISDEVQTPVHTGIHSIYPNPCSASATIHMGIKGATQAYQLEIYNIKGEKVWQASGNAKGFTDCCWNGCTASGTRLPSGIYLVLMKTAEGTNTRKLVLK